MDTPPLDSKFERPLPSIDGVEAQPPPPEHTAQDEPHADEEEDEGDDEDAQLEQLRYIHNQHLKSRFEAIFQKYERDFTGIGDEIDLETGEIVVDNGHLENMQQELDPGKTSQFFRDFAEDLEHEGEEDEEDDRSGSSSDDLGESSDESYTDLEGGPSTSGGTSNGNFGAREQDAKPYIPSFGQNNIPLDPVLQQLNDAVAGNAESNSLLPVPSLDGAGDTGAINTENVQRIGLRAPEENESRPAVPLNVLDMPAVKESLLALKAKKHGGRDIDPDAIEALGASIASQIAQFIGTGGRSKSTRRGDKKRKDPIWDFPELPTDKRRRTTGDQPPQRPSLPLIEAAISPRRNAGEPQESLWAPMRHPKPRRRKRATSPERAPQARPKPPRGETVSLLGQEDTASLLPDELQNDADDVPELRQCYNCGICATTTWRKGPEGDMCNACGMYFYRYGLMRPPRPTTPDIEIEAEHEHRDDSNYMANTSRLITGIGLKRMRRFTVEEDALIIKLKELDRQSWEKIGRHFAGRSSFAVQCRYAKKLIGQPSEGRDALVEQGFTFGGVNQEARDGGFTERDDEFLVQLREESELDWATIAGRMAGQTAETIEARYNLLLGIFPEGAELQLQRRPKSKRPVSSDQPERMSRVFKREEDEMIVTLREVSKLPWSEVSQQMPGRTGLALQKRYVRELDRRKEIVAKGGTDPYAHLFAAEEDSDHDLGNADEPRLRLEEMFTAHSSLTLAEETLLMRLRDEESLDWEHIVDRMPGRSAVVLRNRYEAILVKRETEREKAAVLEISSIFDNPASEGFVPNSNGQSCSTPTAKKAKRYKPEEDKLILKLRGEGLSWERISWYLPGRTAGSLEGRWKNKLKYEQTTRPEGSEAEVESAMTDEVTSAVQDDILDVIDPSLDHLATPSLYREISVPEQIQQPAFLDWDAKEPAGGSHIRSYTPTEDGSEISHDPYQHFETHGERTAEISTERSQQNILILQPAKPGSKYSQQEHDVVAKLRAEGMDWPDIAVRLPGRSLESVCHHWTNHIDQKPAQCNSMSVSSGTAKKAENTLLRQALNNGARRCADEGAPDVDVLRDGTPFGTMMPAGAPSGGLLPGAMVLGDAAPPMNLFHSLLNRSPGRAGEVLISPGHGRPPAEESGEHEQMRRIALLPSALPDAREAIGTSTPKSVSQDIDLKGIVSVETHAGTPESFASAEEGQSALRSSGGHVQDQYGIDNVPSHPETPMRLAYGEQHADDPTPPYTTPSPERSYCTPGRFNQQAMPYFTAPTAVMYSPLAPNPHAEHTPSQAVAGPRLEDGVPSSQQKAAVARARARRSWTPVVNSPEPSDDDTVDMSDAENDQILDKSYSPQRLSLRSDKPPPFSWNELITMALKSSPEQRLTGRDIYTYLEKKFPYFKAFGNDWRNTLGQRLSMSDIFHGSGSGLAAIWSFADKLPVWPEPRRRPVLPGNSQSDEIVHAEDRNTLPLPEPPAQESPHVSFVVSDTPAEGYECPVVEKPVGKEDNVAPTIKAVHAADDRQGGDEVKNAPAAVNVASNENRSEVAMSLGGPAVSYVAPRAACKSTPASAKAKAGVGRSKKVLTKDPLESGNKPKRSYTLFTDADRQRLAPLVVRGAASKEIEAALEGRSLQAFESHLKTQKWTSFIAAYRSDQQGTARLENVNVNNDSGRPYKNVECAQTGHADRTQALLVASNAPPENSASVEPREPPSDEKAPQHRLDKQSTASDKQTSVHAESNDDVLSVPTSLQATAIKGTTQPITSDISRDTESSPATLRAHQKMEEFRRYLAEHGGDVSGSESDETDETDEAETLPQHLAKLQAGLEMQRTSSPGMFSAFADAKKPSPTTAYRKSATPKTPSSSLAVHQRQQGMSTDRSVSRCLSMATSQSSGNSRVRSVWKTSQTPMNPVDGSEDELA